MLTLLDGRCKHKMQYSHDFYLWIKYPKSHIYYVQFKLPDGKKLTLSTKEKTAIEAHKFAQQYWDKHLDRLAQLTEQKQKVAVVLKPKKKNNKSVGIVQRRKKTEKDFFHKVLEDFYKDNSEYAQWAKRHGSSIKNWHDNVSKIEYIGNYFNKVTDFS